jgi:hypothetical protein
MKTLQKFAMRDFSDAIEALLRNGNHNSVTVFCSPLTNVKQRVRVTRKEPNHLLVTFGRPNYREREYLKLCKRSGVKTMTRIKFW